jgi:hypothetical protein
MRDTQQENSHHAGAQETEPSLASENAAASAHPAPFESGFLQSPAVRRRMAERRAAREQAEMAHAQEGGASTPTASGIPAPVLAKMERAFGTDFSSVRVHESSARATAAGALAITQGNDIHFAPGAFDPRSTHGQELLGHELAHVVQQRGGRVAGKDAQRATLNADRSLEREADEAGRAAARGEKVSIAGAGASTAAADGSQVAQPKMGFEIEMLVLVDTDGRPLPEKTVIGNCGPHLQLHVDHGPTVAAPTPRPAVEARYDVDQRSRPHPGAPVGPVLPGAEVEMRRTGGPPDPRLPLNHLDPANWAATTNNVNQEFTRPVSPIQPHLNNTALAGLDVAIPRFAFDHKNWESARARIDLSTIITQADNWLITNANKPNKILYPQRRARWRRVRNAVRDVRNEAVQHRTFWTNPVNDAVPGNMERQMRPTAGPGAGNWYAYQPGDGMGTNFYASILEIVTNPYAPETKAGRTNLLEAIRDAAQLAADIENAAGANCTNRVPLAGIPNIAGVSPLVHIGNPAQPGQTTAGSIQTTGAIDLAHFASYVLSMTGPDPGARNRLPLNNMFALKHHSDTDDDEGRRVFDELPLAVRDATDAINAIKATGVNAPDFVNLRGLVVLICQYLRMGKHFYGHGGRPLDKNMAPFLSRTDLSTIYRDLVPAPEKDFLEKAGRVDILCNEILTRTGRTAAAELMNDATESIVGGGSIPCGEFVGNVFREAHDGVTNTFGGFRKFNPKCIDPENKRAGDTHPVGKTSRHGFLFEMRNMVKRESFSGGRFPRTQWAKIAAQQIAVFAALNARTEADATRNHVFRYTGYGQPTGTNFLKTDGTDLGAW